MQGHLKQRGYKTWSRLVVLSLLTAVILGGCKKENTNQTEEAGIKAYVGNAIFESSLDPIKGAMSYGYPFINEALIQVNTKGEYIGDLAESWEISQDARTYTFRLKEGVRFSDNSVFSAEDVVFTYQQVKENQANNENVDLTKLQEVRAVDEYTVEFVLKEAYSPFIDTTAMLQIVPSDGYDSERFDTNPIGTGAYRVVQYDANQQIILQANENYDGDMPEIKKVTLVAMESEAAFSAAKSGDLDIVMVGSGYAKEEISGMTAVRLETMDVRNISLPVHKKRTVTAPSGEKITVGNDVTGEKAVREALAIGINRQEMIEHAFHGVGKPAMNFTNQLVWAYEEDYQDNQVEKAKEILEEAGWTDTDGDGIREKEEKRCSFDVYAAGGDEERYNLAVALSENAKDLGIEIQVKTTTWDEVITLQNTEGVVWGWGQYSPTVLYSLFYSKLYLNGSYDNVVGYNNEVVDQKIEQALSANEEQAAITAWQEVQKTADGEYPYLYLVNIEHCYFVSDRLDISQETQIPHPHGHGCPIVCNLKDWKWK